MGDSCCAMFAFDQAGYIIAFNLQISARYGVNLAKITVSVMSINGTKKYRVALVDDHELMLIGLINVLASDFEIAGTFADGRSAVAGYDNLRPDVLILDISLPLLNGIEAARQIKKIDKNACILFVTMQTDKSYIEEAFRAGANGYVLKQSAAADLLQALHTVLDRRYYVSPMLIAKLPEMPVSDRTNPAELFQVNLTPRQREVLQLIAEGRSMKEIAGMLRISVRTVEFHKTSIVETLGLRTTAELTKYAIQHGISIAGT